MNINEIKKINKVEGLKECPFCGCTRFLVDEKQVWDACIDNEGVILCNKPEAEVETIICSECGKEFEFNSDTEFNFN